MDIVERAAALLGTASDPSTSRDRPSRESRDVRLVEHLALAAGQAHTSHSQPQASRPQPAWPTQDGSDKHETPASRSVVIDQRRLRAQRIITPEDTRTMMTESFRRVKRHIVANAAIPDGRRCKNLVMITSSLPGEGKTFCSISLAISLAMEINRTVMLVDADFERPCVPAALGIKDDGLRGLIDVIADPSIPLADVLLKTNIGKLSLLPAGTRHEHTTELIAGEATAELLRSMATRYEDRILIFDSAPLLAASEACALASHMGQIVIVVEAGRTTEKTLKEALDSVQQYNVAGVLLNKGVPSAARGDYGYGYGTAK
jgi:receptor protein-tyrosine kinase